MAFAIEFAKLYSQVDIKVSLELNPASDRIADNMRTTLLLLPLLLACTQFQPLPPGSSALAVGYKTPCDGTLLLGDEVAGDLATKLTLSAGHAKIRFKYLSAPSPSPAAFGALPDFRCEQSVNGSAAFDAAANRFYRIHLLLSSSGVQGEVYESERSNGIPAHKISSIITTGPIERHCKIYPACE